MQALVAAVAAIVACLATGALFLAVVVPRRLLEQAEAQRAEYEAAMAAKQAELEAARRALEAQQLAELEAVKARQEASHAADPVDVANDLIGDVVLPPRGG